MGWATAHTSQVWQRGTAGQSWQAFAALCACLPACLPAGLPGCQAAASSNPPPPTTSLPCPATPARRRQPRPMPADAAPPHAGIIAAAGNDLNQVAGLTWGSAAGSLVNILACKFISDAGSGLTSGAVACFDYCLSRGADIISASWSAGSTPNPALEEAVAAAEERGVLVVAASGAQWGIGRWGDGGMGGWGDWGPGGREDGGIPVHFAIRHRDSQPLLSYHIQICGACRRQPGQAPVPRCHLPCCLWRHPPPGAHRGRQRAAQ
jgi:hypothetical protein